MRTGEQLALGAMKKELVRLSRTAERAKAEADECMSIGSELIAIHNEFAEIVNSRATGADTLKKLDALTKRRERADKVAKRNLMKLFDKQTEAEFARDDLRKEIEMIEFKNALRRGG